MTRRLLPLALCALAASAADPIAFAPCPLPVQQWFAEQVQGFHPAKRGRRLAGSLAGDDPFLAEPRPTVFVGATADNAWPTRYAGQALPGGLNLVAYEHALKKASGCASCADGCCDGSDVLLDCGYFNATLDYSKPSGKTNVFPLSLYRVRLTGPLVPLNASNRTHLWSLQGGPGASGLSILFLTILQLQYATDIFVPDYRGTGRSQLMVCPSDGLPSNVYYGPPDASLPSCISYINANIAPVNSVSAANAAQDLASMLTAAKSMFKPKAAFVHGYSYGTRWAQRFLQLHPALADKVVLEGVVARNTSFTVYSVGSDFAGDSLMAKCKFSSTCLKYFPKGVQQVFADIVVQGENNLCSNSFVGTPFSVSGAQSTFAFILFEGLVNGQFNHTQFDPPGYTGFTDFRVASLALVSRWQRCAPSANVSSSEAQENFEVFVAGITKLYAGQGGLLSLNLDAYIPPQEQFNEIVYTEVVQSEFTPRPLLSNLTYANLFKNVLWGPLDSYDSYVTEANSWKSFLYTDHASLFNLAPVNVSTPVLFVNGELDSETPRFEAWQAYQDIKMRGSTPKSIVIQPNAGHSGCNQPYSCSLAVTEAFYASKDGNVDTSICGPLSQSLDFPNGDEVALPSNFELAMPNSVYLTGSADPYEGGIHSSFCSDSNFFNGFVPRTFARCMRCFEYSLLTATSNQQICQAAGRFGSCLAKVKGKLPYTCASLLTPYGQIFGLTNVLSSNPHSVCGGVKACSPKTRKGL